MLSALYHETRLGVRGLLKDKGFAIAAVLSIGLESAPTRPSSRWSIKRSFGCCR